MRKRSYPRHGKPKGSTGQKSTVTKTEFKKRIEAIELKIGDFVEFSGISRSAFGGWGENNIPLYAERVLQLLEIKNSIKLLN
ncbi:MAG: hypothetical protein AB7E49_01430 [Campylobacterales bacterium]